jgi:arsenate reductase
MLSVSRNRADRYPVKGGSLQEKGGRRTISPLYGMAQGGLPNYCGRMSSPMPKRRNGIPGTVARASHSAWPAAGDPVQRMTSRSRTVLALVPGLSNRKAVSRVIFACIRNAGRSQMAVAFFNQEADPRRARAISAGTALSGTIEPSVIDAMRETGIELSPSIPRQLNAPLATSAGHLVTMGCGDDLPFFAGVRLEDWPIDDPNDESDERVRGIRDEIRRRVKEMIDAHGWGRGEGL